MSSVNAADDSFETDFDILKDCSISEAKQSAHGQSCSTPIPKKKIPNRQNFFKCHVHEDNNRNTWSSVHSDCQKCTRFSTAAVLKECVLPRKIDALNLVLTLKDTRIGRPKCTDVYFECSKLIAQRWLSCNVYPMSMRSIKLYLVALFEEYRAIKKFTSKSEAYWQRCTPFLNKMNELFDVQADKKLQKVWFEKTNIKHDIEFYDGQALNPTRGYSTKKTDMKWEKLKLEGSKE